MGIARGPPRPHQLQVQLAIGLTAAFELVQNREVARRVVRVVSDPVGGASVVARRLTKENPPRLCRLFLPARARLSAGNVSAAAKRREAAGFSNAPAHDAAGQMIKLPLNNDPLCIIAGRSRARLVRAAAPDHPGIMPTACSRGLLIDDLLRGTEPRTQRKAGRLRLVVPELVDAFEPKVALCANSVSRFRRIDPFNSPPEISTRLTVGTSGRTISRAVALVERRHADMRLVETARHPAEFIILNTKFLVFVLF